jgi:hypothetical protein
MSPSLWLWWFYLLSLIEVNSGVVLSIPYYECVRHHRDHPKIAGVCSTFESHFLSAEVAAEETFTRQAAIDICTSETSTEFNTLMADAVTDWSLDVCVIYVTSYVEPELKARKHDNLKFESKKEQMEKVFLELDKITESFNVWIEGSIWRFSTNDNDSIKQGLARKRSCLLTSLVSHLKDNAHIAEVLHY